MSGSTARASYNSSPTVFAAARRTSPSLLPSLDTAGNAQNIPSPNNALNLDGDGDVIESKALNLANYNEGYLYFFYQQGDGSNGDRNEPENGDDLNILYYTSQGTWMPMQSLWGDALGYTTFALCDYPCLLSPDAFHSNFKIRR